MGEQRLRVGPVEPVGERRTYSSATSRRRLRLRFGYLAALVLVGLTVCVFLQPGRLLEVWTWSPMAGKEEVMLSKVPIHEVKPGQTRPVHTSGRLVPLEAHIMSKCPDALECLRDLVLPTMQRVYDKVNFTLSFIGRPTHDGGVECMHGPAECMGNILELCAQQQHPDPKIYLGFTMCITRDYKRIPDRDLIEGCALEHAVDFAALNECATRDDGQYAMNLLRDSVQHSTDVGVIKSCTVRLDDKVYCIRDDDEWTYCPSGPGVNDLVISVEKLFRQN